MSSVAGGQIAQLPAGGQKYACHSCGKVFKDNDHLARHKARKTPCVIRDVAPEDVNNPLRCVFCNKIFAKMSNLTRHHTTCKIKNGGMKILAGKTRHEQEMDALRAEMRQQAEQMKQQTEQLKSCIEEIKQLKAGGSTTHNGDNNNVTNNNNINNTINITFQSWDTPDFAAFKGVEGQQRFRDLLAQHGVNVPVELVREIWFNPVYPQNHTIYLVNKSTQEVLTLKDN